MKRCIYYQEKETQNRIEVEGRDMYLTKGVNEEFIKGIVWVGLQKT